MKIRFTPPSRSACCRAAATGLALLALAPSSWAQPKQYNTGRYTNASKTYHTAAFVNSGTILNTGAFATTNSFAAAGVAFTNTGSYTFAAGAPQVVNDQFTGLAAQSLAGSVAPQYYNLTLANPVGTTFALTNTAGLDVAHTLLLSNGLTTTTGATTPPTTAANVAGAIRLGATATLAGSPSTTTYVDGFVAKAGSASFTFPLGATPLAGSGASGSPLYSPITVSNPAGATLRYVAGASAPPSPTSLATQGGGLQLTNVSRREYYPLYAAAGAGLNTSLTMPYTNFGPTGYVGSPAQLTIAGFDGSRWTNLSTTATNTIGGGTVTVTVPAGTDLSSYRALALASTSAANPLPVELTSFGAARQQADGLLRWTTAAELHAAYFEVQASPDGQCWLPLGQVPATGTGSTAHSYTYLDRQLSRYGTALVYYRLRQADEDGTSHFSPVCALAPDSQPWVVAAYPNPFVRDLSAQVTNCETGPVSLTVLDLAGRVLLWQQVVGVPGTQVIQLDQEHQLPAGQYVLIVRQNAHVGTVQVLRQ